MKDIYVGVPKTARNSLKIVIYESQILRITLYLNEKLFFPISEKPDLNLTEIQVQKMNMSKIRREIEKYRSRFIHRELKLDGAIGHFAEPL